MTATDTSTVVLGDTVYTHDANGNLTSDATFTYQYDLANQLTNVIRKADNTTVLSCRYDALGRRVEAIRADGTTDRYVYFPGSFLVLAVLDETNAPKELYTRGPDLSGTLDSAGGIGGILACTYSSSPLLHPLPPRRPHGQHHCPLRFIRHSHLHLPLHPIRAVYCLHNQFDSSISI